MKTRKSIRSLIHYVMKENDLHQARVAIHEGYKDIAAGHYFQSSGDFFKVRSIFEKKEAEGWK